MNRVLAIGLLAACLAGGCGATNTEYVTPERLDKGLVVLLPGIEGEGPLSYSLREGLLQGGVDCALPIYQWGRPIPIAGPLLNQTDVLGNRAAGERIAQMIVEYQDLHPGKPVYMIGHSGGGGVAVFTAESLPQGRQVDGLILLSASISSGYDLSKALAHCQKGIVNYHSEADFALLGIGTALLGNVDGGHGGSAGAKGFDHAFPRLYPMPWQEGMRQYGNGGGHMDSTASPFVERYIAPWIRAASWPAGYAPAAGQGKRGN